MVRQMTMTKKAAKDLAVAYSAFNAAMRDPCDRLGHKIWGRSLLRAQEAAGLQLHNPDVINAIIKSVLREEAAKQTFIDGTDG